MMCGYRAHRAQGLETLERQALSGFSNRAHNRAQGGPTGPGKEVRVIINLRTYQKNIISDIYKAFQAGFRRPLVTAPCGSGKTVVFSALADLTARKGNSVSVLVHRRELMAQTNQTLIAVGNPANVKVHMAQTYTRHLDEYTMPDLIITDEAHMAASNTWRRIYDHWPESFVIGFSASPCRLDQKPLGDVFDHLIIGPSTAELIQQGYLADYRYYSVTVADLAGLRRKGRDYDQDAAAEALMRRAVYGDAIANWRERAGSLRTVVYCATVDHSKQTADEFRQAGYNAEHIDGTMANGKRDQLIADFRSGKIQILTNCDIVSTGFDLPDIDCCLMLRPTMSTALHIQQAGRALRPRPGKTAVILDCVGNYIRHGLPDDDRQWSLETELPNRPRLNQDGSYSVRQCKYCFACFPSSRPDCPQCGMMYRSDRAEIESIEAVTLREIERRKQQRADRYRARREGQIDTESDCRSYQDLYLLAKKTGHPDPRRYAIHRSYALGYRLPWERRRA